MQVPSQPSTAIDRLTPVDVPMSPELPEATLDALKSHPFFQGLDQAFRSSPRFEKAIRTHSRIVDCEEGDVIVREGDWGNSAFVVLEGEVAVEVEPPGAGLSMNELGRRTVSRKSLLESLSQLWRKRPFPEYRDVNAYASQKRSTGLRDDGIQTYFQDVPRLIRDFKTVRLGQGELFGELAALGRTARTATVFALSDQTQLLEIRWQGIRDLMKADAGLRQRIDETFRDNALRSFLRDLPLLQHVAGDKAVMDEFVRAAELKTFGDYDKVSSFKQLAEAGAARSLAGEPVIAAEGDYPNGVTLIRSGVARLSHKHHDGHRTLSYLTPGKVFGFEEIARGWEQGQTVPLKYSLRSIGYLSAIVLPTSLVEEHLLDPRSKSSKRPRKAPDSCAVSTGKKAVDPDGLAFLVEGGFVNGTATMLVNLDRCTRCDDCVRACASTHDNNPRFLRQGPIHGNLMVAHACMHCQDPVCMIECPTGAISRQTDDGQVTINDQTCIGCATCSRNCPYEAIRMVEVRDEKGMFIRATKDQKTIQKATKCDLCVDYRGGPACQRACPHDALVRIDMSNVASLSAWLRR